MSDDSFFTSDELENVDPRNVSQFANVLLGKTKGGRGRRTSRQKREERANEKGIINVFDYLRKTKGVGCSLGEK